MTILNDVANDVNAGQQVLDEEHFDEQILEAFEERTRAIRDSAKKGREEIKKKAAIIESQANEYHELQEKSAEKEMQKTIDALASEKGLDPEAVRRLNSTKSVEEVATELSLKINEMTSYLLDVPHSLRGAREAGLVLMVVGLLGDAADRINGNWTPSFADADEANHPGESPLNFDGVSDDETLDDGIVP